MDFEHGHPRIVGADPPDHGSFAADGLNKRLGQTWIGVVGRSEAIGKRLQSRIPQRCSERRLPVGGFGEGCGECGAATSEYSEELCRFVDVAS